MTRYVLSKHAGKRRQQRGFKSDDIQFVFQHGTETADGFVMTDRDIADIEARSRYEVEKAKRLRGVLVGVAGEVVKTIFKATPSQISRLI